MHSLSRRGYVSTLAWLAGTGLCAALVGSAAMFAPATPSPTLSADEGIHQLDPNLTYLGNAGCTGSGCHSGEAKKHGIRSIGNENTLWDDKDPHSKAFKNLTNDKGKKIAASMKIDDAAKSARCTQCHATDAPKKGPKFNKDLGKEGVSCESCHGAAEKWNEPHQKDGWTDGQRAAIGPAGLKSQFGMIDTFNLAVRADVCVSCHLHIDKDMLDAGHPALDFEMYNYNNYKFAEKWQPHWDEHGTAARKAQMWGIGQVAAAKAAKGQVEAWKAKSWDTKDAESLAKLFGEGAVIVKANFGSDDPATLAKTEPGKDKIKAALAALVAAAEPYKSGKEFAHHRATISSGVDALASATMDVPANEYVDAAEAAPKAEGDSWIALLKKMQAAAK